MKFSKIFLAIGTFVLLALSFSDAKAQSDYKPFNINASLKNMHLWRGYKVTNSAVSVLDLKYTTENGKFYAGLWNGNSFDGEYTEFDYYFGFNFGGGLSLAVWDINNFSSYPGADVFNYTNDETSHFIDVALSYQVTPKFGLTWGTIVAGRDYYMDGDDAKNRYSTYVEANANVYAKDDFSLNALAGFAFSFDNADDENFYGSQPNFVNIGLSGVQQVSILGRKLPVSATAMWNPELKHAAMQLSITLF